MTDLPGAASKLRVLTPDFAPEEQAALQASVDALRHILADLA